MTDFQIHFTRYSSDTCSRLNSAPWYVKAPDIAEAVRMAGLFIDGMKSAGCTDEVLILAMQMQGVRGEQCHSTGLNIWDMGEDQ